MVRRPGATCSCWSGKAAGRPAPRQERRRAPSALGALRPPREDPRAAATAPVRPPRRHPPRGHLPLRRPHPAQRHRRLGRPHRQRQPVRFTPHDFRRLFTTELVGAGLPLHIAASLLGHLSLDTTRGYTAVFPENLIAAHEALIERRRKQRQDAELRSASGEQWAEFEQHFLLRKVALGDCHRPNGTPLRPRTRLHPMPLPPRRPRPTRTTRADDHQRRSPTGRSPRPRLARRSRPPRRQPDPPATTAHRGRSPTPSLDRGVQLCHPSSLGSKVLAALWRGSGSRWRCVRSSPAGVAASPPADPSQVPTVAQHAPPIGGRPAVRIGHALTDGVASGVVRLSSSRGPGRCGRPGAGSRSGCLRRSTPPVLH